jgi:hypothetical protein
VTLGWRAVRNTLLALAVVVGAIVAHLHVESQIYHPVVQFSSPEGLSFTAVLKETRDRTACGDANERFLRPIKERCKQCRVVLARCERNLEGLERDLMDGAALAQHVIVGPGLRMAISGPAQAAKWSCDYLAADMVGRGLRRAACIPPRAVSKS